MAIVKFSNGVIFDTDNLVITQNGKDFQKADNPQKFILKLLVEKYIFNDGSCKTQEIIDYVEEEMKKITVSENNGNINKKDEGNDYFNFHNNLSKVRRMIDSSTIIRKGCKNKTRYALDCSRLQIVSLPTKESMIEYITGICCYYDDKRREKKELCYRSTYLLHNLLKNEEIKDFLNDDEDYIALEKLVDLDYDAYYGVGKIADELFLKKYADEENAKQRTRISAIAEVAIKEHVNFNFKHLHKCVLFAVLKDPNSRFIRSNIVSGLAARICNKLIPIDTPVIERLPQYIYNIINDL